MCSELTSSFSALSASFSPLRSKVFAAMPASFGQLSNSRSHDPIPRRRGPETAMFAAIKVPETNG
jgi:hypothetical protein